MTGKKILKSNFLIVYQDLKDAINEYLSSGHCQGKTEKIDAYLAATIHALIDFDIRCPYKDRQVIQAFEYANNTLKHNKSLISHKEISGGVTFPVEFPIEIPKITVIWNYDSSVKAKYKNQQQAFEDLFAGREIFQTLEPLAKWIASEAI